MGKFKVWDNLGQTEMKFKLAEETNSVLTKTAPSFSVGTVTAWEEPIPHVSFKIHAQLAAMHNLIAFFQLYKSQLYLKEQSCDG